MEESTIRQLEERDFEEIIESGKTCLIFFGAARCHTCRERYPVFEEIVKEFGNKFEAYQVDVDVSKNLAQRMRLKGIPTLIVFKDGGQIKKIKGVLPKEELAGILERIV